MMDWRSKTVEELRREPLDLLIVGGGIVGSGIARDAAMRGLRTGLVEQHDFASGTSSRSTRLLHGGLRYLAQGRVGLVRESSLEKGVIHRIAPHLAEPLPFVFPTYRCPPWGTWALWKLRIGVKIYDLLCGGRNLGKSSSMSAAKTAKYIPGLRRKNLTGAVRYFDGFTQDARLVIDTLRSAGKHGAHLLNYCRLESARHADGGWGCTLSDELSGEKIVLSARSVVNAAGPWGDQLEQSVIQLRPTKGVHLVVDRARLPVPDAVVLTKGSRILFAIPWEERVLLGTTDTDYQGSLEDVRTEPADVDYILQVVNAAFPEAKLAPGDVISEWAGLRPLIQDPNGNPSDISRSHEIRSSPTGWIDVAGGKLTTYRLMAEQAVDRLGKTLGVSLPPCRTASEPLLAKEETEGLSAIVPPPLTRRAVEHYCQEEWAIHLDDVMLRRGGWHFYHHDADKMAEQVLSWMAEIFAWDDERRAAEKARYQSKISMAPDGSSNRITSP